MSNINFPRLYSLIGIALFLCLTSCGDLTTTQQQEVEAPQLPYYQFRMGIEPLSIDELPCMEDYGKGLKGFFSRFTKPKEDEYPTYVDMDDAIKQSALWHQLIIKNTQLIEDERSIFLDSIVARFDQKLFKKISYNEYAPYKVYLIESEETLCFSTGAGNIYMTSNLYSLAKDAAQLAFVIAREMAHTFLGHTTYDTEFREKIADKIVTGSWNQVNSLIEEPQQITADFSAVCMIYEAGYHPEYSLHFLNVMRDKGTLVRSSFSHYHVSERRLNCLANYLIESKEQ